MDDNRTPPTIKATVIFTVSFTVVVLLLLVFGESPC